MKSKNMENQFKIFTQKVEELARECKPKIAFGLANPDEDILGSLKRSKEFADIILVGPEAIKDIEGFEKTISDNPEEKIASMLFNNEVEGIVRGTIDDFKTIEAYQKLSGEKNEFNPGIMEDTSGRQFLIAPCSNPEAWEKEDRLKLAKKMADFLKEWDIEPKIAVFTGVRHDTYPRRKDIRDGVVGILNKTYEDAEWIVGELKTGGLDAKNWAIDLNPAVEAGCNVIVPVNGMVGNQIFRAMLICGGKILAATRIDLSRPYEDNSRTEKDFDFHIKWLVALINMRNKK